ncbi:MAG: hypothetical protein WD278_19315 [Pirellulales bacterium]
MKPNGLRPVRMMAALLAGVSLAGQGGCVSALATALYVIKGANVPAAFGGLKDKRVAVVCRPVAELEYSSTSAATDISVAVGRLLKKNVRNIKVIDPAKIADWTDEHTWDDYTEIGEALEAEMVLGIDLEGFGLLQGQTLYQGKAKVLITVYDMKKGGEVVYQKPLPQTVYPPNSSIPTQDKPEDEFRRQFVAVVADEIGRHFYAHDAHADFAKDSMALK